MDPRIREHAEILVDHCTDVEPGDSVVVSGSRGSEDLVVAVAALCGERGAAVRPQLSSQRARRAYARAIDEDDVVRDEALLALFEAADVLISIRGRENVAERSDVPLGTSRAIAAANGDLQEAHLASRWNLTLFPTPAEAQRAEMSTAAYEDFVWGAINKDWDAVAERQERLVDRLDGADEVHIVSGETTDVRLSVAGNVVRSDVGEHNMPGGEVSTAPVRDSAEGEVLFDLPVRIDGREVTDAWLRLEDGKVVDHAAGKNEAVLTSHLETDDGSRFLGELGIGMNRDIDRFTGNTLFDEKMGDTVHLAIGMAYEDSVGEDNERNESAVHTDMLVDMSEDSFIEVDGEVIQRDGTFRWEESEGDRREPSD